MLHSVVLLIISCRWLEPVFADEESASDNDFGSGLISSLKNDAIQDLSVDEEYEDLRAEALAYHSALASLKTSRRLTASSKYMPLINTYKDVFIGSQGGKPQLGSMKATCWARGGICIHVRLCPDNKSFDIAVSGCSNNFKVCCKMFQQLSPTVGIQRSRAEERDTQEIDSFSKEIAKPGDSQVLMSIHFTL